MVEIKKPIDRISLNDLNKKKLESWLDQIHHHLKGMVKITKTDLVNCLLADHPEELSESEIKSAAKFCFDEVRWLNSAMERLKAAKKVGQNLSMEDLLIERKELIGEAIKAPRGRPKTTNKVTFESTEKPSHKGDAST